MEICGEEDRFCKGKVQIATLQISKISSNIDHAESLGHGHRREDIAKHFRKVPRGNIHYTKLFEELRKHLEANYNKLKTDAAKKKLFVRYGNLVVIVGQPGIGKSTLTKHMVEEMWEKSLFNPDLIFFLRFRDVDYQAKTDLLEFFAPYVTFISNKNDRIEILEKIKNTKNIFIIMDGMDEANIDPKMKNAPTYYIDKDFPAEVYIQNLFEGNILPQSKKIVTSRPHRIIQLPEDFQPKLIYSIQGLDKSAINQICLNICSENHAIVEKIVGYLENHLDLQSLCYIPVICIMVAESLYKIHAREYRDLNSYDANVLLENNVDTITTIFVLFLQKWLTLKFERTESSFQLKEISELALKSFNKNQYYFQDVHLRKAKIDYQNTTTFFNTIFRGSDSTQMHFVHLTWHEFLASVKMRLFSKIEDFNSYIKDLNSFKYEFVTRFLFGLCRTHTLQTLLKYVETVDFCNDDYYEESKKILQGFAIQKLESHRDDTEKTFDEYFQSVLPVLGWIYEMRDDQFTIQAAAYLRDEIRIRGQIIPSDIPIVNYLLRHRKSSTLLRLIDPCFVGNCFQYFFKELEITLDRNPSIQVSVKLKIFL